jgi:hypothetical protein
MKCDATVEVSEKLERGKFRSAFDSMLRQQSSSCYFSWINHSTFLTCAALKELSEKKIARLEVSPENAWTRVLQHEVLVRELVTVDALSSRSVVIREVPTLAHESRYDSVEGRSLEAESLLACDFNSTTDGERW